jgi:hypothetical protein
MQLAGRSEHELIYELMGKYVPILYPMNFDCRDEGPDYEPRYSRAERAERLDRYEYSQIFTKIKLKI